MNVATPTPTNDRPPARTSVEAATLSGIRPIIHRVISP
jgi:hypothetical protein